MKIQVISVKSIQKFKEYLIETEKPMQQSKNIFVILQHLQLGLTGKSPINAKCWNIKGF